MDHAKKMPGGTGSMMSRRKTLGSMMNPQPMQFAMGAKMYTHGGSHSGMAPDVSGYEEVTGLV